jgi:hypothetical protein
MSELKPLGSEKLNGDAKLQRILELTYFNQNNKKSNSTKPELVKESKTGGVYGIVKEKDGYYVKRGLNESSLDYIGGMFMKNKNKFSSYVEALKRMNLLEGQDSLQEATKYVLKQNKPEAPAAPSAPQQEAPAPEPSLDVPPSNPTPDMGGAPAPDASAPSDSAPMGDDMPPSDGGQPSGNEEGGEPKRSDYMEEIQKFAGKLGQELRDQHERLESDDIKYVLNMVISAVDLEKLSDEDIEDIGKKFERDEKYGQEGQTSDTPEEQPSSDKNQPSGEEDLSENNPMDKLEAFINHPMDEIDLSSYSHGSDEPVQNDEEFDFGNHADLEHGDVDEEKELDLDEIKNSINQAVAETLSNYFK